MLFAAVPAHADVLALMRACLRGVRLLAPRAELLPTLPPQFIARAERLHGKPFDPKLVVGSWSKPSNGRQPGMDKEGRLKIHYDGDLVADIDYYYKNGTLRFDIEIPEPYRGTKLYEYTLAQCLKECPATTSIPARWYHYNSDNGKVFVQEVFGSAGAMQAFPPKQLGTQEVKAFRQNVYDALYEMPAMKARERNGFGRITKVIFNPNSTGMALVVEKGPRGPPGEMKVYLEKKNPWELTDEGNFIRVPDPSVLELRDYADFHHW